ncbi:hypothetical protein ACWCQN_05755 [Streptomyces sp. NPDC001984]
MDVIQGDVTGPVSDKDTFTTPHTKVVKSFEVNKSTGSVRLAYSPGQGWSPDGGHRPAGRAAAASVPDWSSRVRVGLVGRGGESEPRGESDA